MTFRCGLLLLTALLISTLRATSATPDSNSLLHRPWYEARTQHFRTYSCGPGQEVSRLTAQLEQFQEAYAYLAGSQAVSSPPIIVMAFPDHATMQPFLPLYQDQPANLAAFFVRGSDENLIVLSLSREDAHGLLSVFHEYTHLLFRHNAKFWPLWLNEGMAEVYSTFRVMDDHTVQIGHPLLHHIRYLKQNQLMPLSTLFAVKHDSAEYNEREHQGLFYAESWLLTHYLMTGANPALRARFGQLTTLLRQGQNPEQAFTNALQISTVGMANLLRQYLDTGVFVPLTLNVKTNLRAARYMQSRSVTPVEVLFRLGDELFRINRLDAAESYFTKAQKLAPASPLPYEGLGLLAADRKQTQTAVDELHEAIQRGSTSYLAYYIYAMEKFQLTAKSENRFGHIDDAPAEEIRSDLKKSLALMPDFGPAHHLLGFFELVQREDLADAEAHLRLAIQLEPENQAYLFSLAEAQMARKDPNAARRTLEMLRLPYIDAKLRADAEQMLREIDKHPPREATN